MAKNEKMLEGNKILEAAYKELGKELTQIEAKEDGLKESAKTHASIVNML